MKLTSEEIERLQSNQQNIRNICILAHVDHGKTSLSDSLLASNGIISQRMAGKVRYLDSRPDEQLRGITMESSAISLYFKTIKKLPNSKTGDEVSESEDTPEVKSEIKEFLINLIDSPGHIDFSSEVSTASRLCDGAVVLVDVVEGVCSQTITVLRQAWVDKLKPILVLNKIDRLITELQMTSLEAYLHMNKVIEQVNSVTGSFFAGERMQDDLIWREKLESGKIEEFIEKSDEDLYFSPEKNNVIFASAIDGWGFNIQQFSVIFERKLGMNRDILQKVLWGDFYLDPKTKKVINSKALKGRNLKPLFVSLVLDSIWTLYDSVLINRDQEKLEKIVKSLNVKILPRDLRSKDTKTLIRSIIQQWLPVSNAILLTVIDKLPSPIESQRNRIPSILESSPGHDLIDQNLKNDMLTCNINGLVSAYVSKMISVPEDELPQNQRVAMTQDEMFERGRLARIAAAKAAETAKKVEEKAAADAEAADAASNSQTEKNGNSLELENDDFINNLSSTTNSNDPFEYEYEDEYDDGEDENLIEIKKEVLIGFSRIYSGTIEVGQEVTVLGPKYDPSKPHLHIKKVKITNLYLIMGRELVALQKVPAGNIVGIGGLEKSVLKSGSIISPNISGVNLAGVNLTTPPIVRVALEPVNPTQMDRLVKGLELLNQADPCVQTFVQSTGELILATAGELHLERCLKDLKERFAGIEISSSKPDIPYRETIISNNNNEMNPQKTPDVGPRGWVNIKLGKYSIKLSVKPLPENTTKFLNDNHLTISKLVNSQRKLNKKVTESDEDEDEDAEVEVELKDEDELDEDDNFGTAAKELSLSEFKSQLDESLKTGNDLKLKENIEWSDKINRIVSFGPKRTGANILFDSNANDLSRFFNDTDYTNNNDNAKDKKSLFEFADSLLNGYQLATLKGPLASEPTEGVAVFIESIEELPEEEVSNVTNISGRMITSFRDAIYQGYLDWSPRIMLAMYSCDIQASAEVLGKVYAVVQKRRGRIISEEMKEGTPFFTIEARIPVVEAFGFSEDIRKKTSGAASPQLVFVGYEMIDLDPFWVPTTQEELEELGEFAERENVARRYMNQIRRKKGMFVDEKVIKNAEKQRTLKKD
ncbi:hypothetical protein BVG19_g3171 [[Candida] boidinii]|nr:hypothetical protein BVG19_g3171 [[Candida] boidinii]OWB52454.1 hypothetical protein B5S27_g4029 [[Candida] boidinii]